MAFASRYPTSTSGFLPFSSRAGLLSLWCKFGASGVFALILTCATVPAAKAATLAGAVLPDAVQVKGQTLLLNGLGIRKATIFGIKVYVAGLYLAQKSSDPAAIIASPGSKELLLHFLRSVRAEQMEEAWREGFAANAENLEALASRIDELCSLMKDVEEGDRLSFVLTDDIVEVRIGETKAGRQIKGRDFQAALLSIWLGQNPPNEDLKSGLLGAEH